MKVIIMVFTKEIFFMTNQGRIQAHFKIGNHLWVHKNRCPNFARSAKDIILILFNSSQIDLKYETQI